MSLVAVSSIVESHTKDSPDYETLRTRYNNGYVPGRKPREIVTARSTTGVAAAMKRAWEQGLQVGVRSGGHQWTSSGLLQDGMLFDMQNVNHKVIYDEKTETITFGPACNGFEMSEAMQSVGRFFPHGHTGSVAMGGFLAAGGQGWFFRGWGLTCETWILQIEVVTVKGEVLICNDRQNSDLFWAARGSGQGFFAVVTKYWGRTIPERNLFQHLIVFNASESYEEIMDFIFQANDATPGEGTDCSVASFFPDKYTKLNTEEVHDRSLLMIAVVVVAYTDTLASAQDKLAAYSESNMPDSLKKHVAKLDATRPTSWDELFKDQDDLIPLENGERWQCGSILSDPETSRADLIRMIKPALYDLPTRRSLGCIAMADVYPQEKNQAASIQQRYYIASMICWTDPKRDGEIHQWLADINERMEPGALGMYVADFNLQFAVKKVMSDGAFERYTRLRSKWDPEERFQGFRGLNNQNYIPGDYKP